MAGKVVHLEKRQINGKADTWCWRCITPLEGFFTDNPDDVTCKNCLRSYKRYHARENRKCILCNGSGLHPHPEMKDSRFTLTVGSYLAWDKSGAFAGSIHKIREDSYDVEGRHHALGFVGTIEEAVALIDAQEER